MKKFLLVFLPLSLIGCAQINEGLHSIGGDAPENAPPGYYSFQRGEKFAANNDVRFAEFNYCNAAKLGHPDAKAPCVKYAYLQAQQEPIVICHASNYDSKAKELCNDYSKKGPDYVRGQAAKIVQEQKEQEIARENKKRIKKGIDSGTYNLKKEAL